LHGWIHIVSDLAIWGAYLTIPLALVFFVTRRKDVPFPRIFWLFGLFIVSCGTGHLVEAGIFWWPMYRLSAVVKVITALASWATVIVLLPILPKALALPGLARVNADLEKEIQERIRTEHSLVRQSNELARFNEMAVGREVRMVELKQEVNNLCRELGRPARYDLSRLQPAS
jgi:hypothetical protein